MADVEYYEQKIKNLETLLADNQKILELTGRAPFPVDEINRFIQDTRIMIKWHEEGLDL